MGFQSRFVKTPLSIGSRAHIEVSPSGVHGLNPLESENLRILTPTVQTLKT